MAKLWKDEGQICLKVLMETLSKDLLFGVISRTEVERRTGGLLKRRTLANLDSKGLGPKRKIYRNGQVGYYVIDVCELLEKRFRVESVKK